MEKKKEAIRQWVAMNGFKKYRNTTNGVTIAFTCPGCSHDKLDNGFKKTKYHWKCWKCNNLWKQSTLEWPVPYKRRSL